MAESMACGTPVIAFPRGAAPEVIENGKTGFLCENVEDAARAVERVRRLSRSACHERAADLFSSERNVKQHDALFRRLAARPLESVAAPQLGQEALRWEAATVTVGPGG